MQMHQIPAVTTGAPNRQMNLTNEKTTEKGESWYKLKRFLFALPRFAYSGSCGAEMEQGAIF